MTKNKAAKARKKAYATAKRASIKAAVSDRYLTVKEAAEWLKMSESHIYFLKHKKKIPHVKLGGKLLFEKESLKKWVESNSSAPTPFARKSRKKKEQYYDIGTNQLVDAPSKEVTYDGAKRFLSALKKETELPKLETVLELGHLQIQILRTGKEVSIIPDMNGDPIDISAGICSLMMKNPAYRKVFETGVYMYQSFKKP
jgi:excisionase family DNA binding protein